MTGWHLAEVNVARWKVDPENEAAAGFVNNVERVNRLAETSPGFVWRLLDESANPFGTDTIVTLSLWESLTALRGFVYRSFHREILVQREAWFHEMPGPSMALWWVPAGTLPDLTQAEQRLKQLETEGPTAEAFSFRQPFPAPVEAA